MMKPRKKIASKTTRKNIIPDLQDIYPSTLAFCALATFLQNDVLRNDEIILNLDPELDELMNEYPRPVQELYNALANFVEILVKHDQDILPPGTDPLDPSLIHEIVSDEVYERNHTAFFHFALMEYTRQHSPHLYDRTYGPWLSGKTNSPDWEVGLLAPTNETPSSVTAAIVYLLQSSNDYDDWKARGGKVKKQHSNR